MIFKYILYSVSHIKIGISRSDFPVRYDRTIYTLDDDTSHESHGFEFIVEEGKCCDQCGELIEQGSLVSVGSRDLFLSFPDATFSVLGKDIVHVQCYSSNGYPYFWKFENDRSYERHIVLLAVSFENAVSLRGFAHLSREKKLWLYRLFKAPEGVDLTNTQALRSIPDPGDEALKDVRQAFFGFNVCICGETPIDTKILVERNGGLVYSQWNSSVRYCILGKAGKTEYGQPTGARSKKYKDLKQKGNIVVVSPDFINAFADAFHKGIVTDTAHEYLRRKWRANIRKKAPKLKQLTRDDEELDTGSRKKRSREEFENDKPEDVPTAAAAASSSSSTAQPDSIDVMKKIEEGIVYVPPGRKALTHKQLEGLKDLPRAQIQAIAKRHNIKQTLSTEQLISEIKEAEAKESSAL